MRKKEREELNRRREELLRRVEEECGEHLFGLCVAFFPHDKQQQDAVYSDIMYRLWSKADRYKEEGDLMAWSYRLAHNVVVSHYRSERVRRRLFLPLTQAEEQVADDDVVDLRVETLYRLIDDLPPREREVVIFHLEGKTVAETARCMNISETNVSTMRHRIKEKLVNMYKDEGQNG